MGYGVSGLDGWGIGFGAIANNVSTNMVLKNSSSTVIDLWAWNVDWRGIEGMNSSKKITLSAAQK